MDNYFVNALREWYYELFRFRYGVRDYGAGRRLLSYDDYWKEGANTPPQFYPTHRIAFDWIEPGSSVLDVGCGWSALPIRLMKEKNCTVTGVEMSAPACARLRKEGVQVCQEDLRTYQPSEGTRYDYALFMDVLEHLPMPEQVLLTLRPYFRKAIISLPNSAYFQYRLCLLRGHFFTQWVHHPAEHLRFWSHTDFLRWLRWLGLTIEESRSANGPPLVRDLLRNLCGHQICYRISSGCL